jgi:hypothetical protein
VSYSHNNLKFVSGSSDLTLKIWDAVAWEAIRTVETGN